eukprot:COSAG01_NODE_8269_length_2849_cov_3.143636_4_plen_81_part_00
MHLLARPARWLGSECCWLKSLISSQQAVGGTRVATQKFYKKHSCVFSNAARETLEGRLYFRVNTYNGVIPTRYPIQRVGV